MDLKLVLSPLMQRMRSSLKSIQNRIGCKGVGITIHRNAVLDNVGLADYVNIAHDAELSNVDIGRRTSIGRYTKIRDAKIGSYCSISWDVTIGAVSHPLDHPSSHAFTYRKQFGIVDSDIVREPELVYIENDVWIGCNVVIMPGVTIGNGSVVGAGSVVTKDVPPYTIVAGNPAHVIRARFDEELSKQLNDSCWWAWSDEKIKKNIDFFTTSLSQESLDGVLTD